MAEIVKIAEFFLISLGVGVGFFTNIASSRLTGEGFQKLINTVCAVSLFVGTILHITYASPTGAQAICYYVTSISFLLIRQLHKDEKSPMMWALYGTHCIAGLLLIWFFQAGVVKNFAFLLSSAAYLGVITYAMVLGHYYLVVPKLTVKPLMVSLQIMWVLFAIKLVWSIVATTGSWAYFEANTYLGGGYAFNWLMLLMRYIWGYVIILVMSIFGWKLVVLRSTQSATGILYAMTIFVFIGEMISTYLFFKYGMFI